MSGLIGVLFIVGLCVWILVDMWLMRRRKFAVPAPEDPNGAKAKQLKQGRYFMIGFGLAVYAMAYNEWIRPPHPPFKGKLSSIYLALYQNFGPHAISVFSIVIATTFVFTGLLLKRPKLAPDSSSRPNSLEG